MAVSFPEAENGKQNDGAPVTDASEPWFFSVRL